MLYNFPLQIVLNVQHTALIKEVT